jgi:hypothetical protein
MSMNELWFKLDELFQQLVQTGSGVFELGGDKSELYVVYDRKSKRSNVCPRSLPTLDFIRFVRGRIAQKDMEDWCRENSHLVTDLDELLKGFAKSMGARQVNQRILGMMDTVMKESGIEFKRMPAHHQQSIIKHLNGVSGVLSKYAKGGA